MSPKAHRIPGEDAVLFVPRDAVSFGQAKPRWKGQPMMWQELPGSHTSEMQGKAQLENKVQE